MAVYTALDLPRIRTLLHAYPHVGDVVDATGIAAGSINTTYRVTTSSGVLFLRINEGKVRAQLEHETALLACLAQHRLGATTPLPLTDRAGDPCAPIDVDDTRKWALVFPQLPGHDITAVDVTPTHLEQVGAFLAHAHVAVRHLRPSRANPFGQPVVEGWLREIEAARVVPDVVTELAPVLAWVRRHRHLLPRGVVHGDLFIDNSKWEHDRLVAVFDWEMAGRDHLMFDVAVCLHAWCWRRDVDDRAGGAYVPALCRALLRGYQSVRPLHDSERRGLFVEALLTAARFTLSRVRDFEVPRVVVGERVYLDHRDFLRRVRVLRALGRRRFRELVGVA